jgi:hypothetical protein
LYRLKDISAKDYFSIALFIGVIVFNSYVIFVSTTFLFDGIITGDWEMAITSLVIIVVIGYTIKLTFDFLLKKLKEIM